MNNPENIFKRITKFFIFALPIIGVIGLIVPLLFKQYNFVLLGTYLAIPFIIAPIIFRAYSKSNDNSNESQKIFLLNQDIFKIFTILYSVLFTISIILLYISEIRTYIYYFVITLMAAAILSQIIFFELYKKNIIIIFFEMTVLLLNLCWGVTLNYYFFIGRTDPVGHAYAIQNLIQHAHIDEVIFGIYTPFPLWHIYSTISYFLLAIIHYPWKVMFLINGLIFTSLILIIYLITLKLVKKEKIALLAGFFSIFLPDILFHSMTSISRSVVVVLFVFLILILVIQNYRASVISLILIFPLILYHTASMPFIIIILFSIFILETYFKNSQEIINLNFLISIIIFTVGYWIIQAEPLVQTLVENTVSEPPEGIITKAIVYTPFNEFMNYLNYMPLLFFLIIGCLYILFSNNFSINAKIFSLIGLFSIPFAFPGPSLLINKLAENFNIGRFGDYLVFFIVLPTAVGFFYCLKKSSRIYKAIIVLLALSMCFLAISNDFIASDNPIIKRPFYTYYLTQEEVISCKYMSNISTGYIFTDYVAFRFLRGDPYLSNIEVMRVDENNLTTNNNNDIFLIRTDELNKRPLKIATSNINSDSYDYYYKDSEIWKNFGKFNKIYQSKGVITLN